MKGDPTHDAEWQPAIDFIDQDGTMNEAFYNYIKKNRILQHLWDTEDNDVIGTTTGEGGE